MTATFDVRGYMRSPRDVRPEGVDLGAMSELRGPTAAALAQLWHVERSALDRARDLRVTPTHADFRVTAFLTTWTYEQYWLTRTLGTLLAANGGVRPEPRTSSTGRTLRRWDEECRPAVDAVRTNLLGSDITGAHMVIGWLDTAAITLTYRQLAATDPHVGGLAAAVERVKERHQAFYADEASVRLSRSTGARRLARRAAARRRWPGTRYTGTAGAAGVMPLLRSRAGRLALESLDDGVAAFPGLAGMHPVRRAVIRLAAGPIR